MSSWKHFEGGLSVNGDNVLCVRHTTDEAEWEGTSVRVGPDETRKGATMVVDGEPWEVTDVYDARLGELRARLRRPNPRRGEQRSVLTMAGGEELVVPGHVAWDY